MDVFEALADPVRREILDILRSGECEAGTIAARFTISRPAISRHLRVLREAGLVEAQLEGRNRIYSLRTVPMVALADWLAPYREGLVHAETQATPTPPTSKRSPWEGRLDALKTEVFRTRRERRAAEASSAEPAPTTTLPQEREESA